LLAGLDTLFNVGIANGIGHHEIDVRSQTQAQVI
jgi:hypothetical protein